MTPSPERMAYLRYAFETGMSVREAARLTGMDPWFLHQMKMIADELQKVEFAGFDGIEADDLRAAKRMGISAMRDWRRRWGVMDERARRR